MPKARFIGDPRHGGQGPARMTMLDVAFVKGEWADVSAAVANRLAVNNHFEIDTDGDGEPGPTIESLRADLDSLGVKYHHKAGVERLSDLLDQATAPNGDGNDEG